MSTETGVAVDVRCASQCARTRQCQLLVRHDAEHAAMACAGDTRVITTWTDGTSQLQESAHSAYRFAWAPGFPSVVADPIPIYPLESVEPSEPSEPAGPAPAADPPTLRLVRRHRHPARVSPIRRSSSIA